MKIQCDVCNKDEASVFCTADEAALCDGCDHRVHHANRLASKHHRFSLHRPSSKQSPLCDVCQEKRAFVFCQQDRAILCKDCDSSIHSANELTQKHDRFLLTGVKLSSNSIPPSDSVSVPAPAPSIAKSTPPSAAASTTTLPNAIESSGSKSDDSSNISEYLIETLPGWQVEDFLDSYSTPFGFCKGDGMSSLFDADIGGNLGSFWTESKGIWVPQAPTIVCSSQMDRVIGQCETKEATKGNRSRLRDDNFAVPQISPVSNPKRPRFLW